MILLIIVITCLVIWGVTKSNQEDQTDEQTIDQVADDHANTVEWMNIVYIKYTYLFKHLVYNHFYLSN